MNTLIYRVLGASDEELRNTPSENNAIELARLLFFLCVAAYNMRTIEMRCACTQTPSGLDIMVQSPTMTEWPANLLWAGAFALQWT